MVRKTINSYLPFRNKYMTEQELWKLYTDELKQYKPLSAEEENALAKLWTPEAKEKLFLHSTGLVIHIAKNYQNCWVSFLDLVSEWMMGLKKAIDEYDPTMMDRLATYAGFRIKIYITNFIVKFKTVISLPSHIYGEINNIYKLMEQENITIDNVGQILKRPISRDRVIRIMNIMSPTISLDTCKRNLDEEGLDLKDMIMIPKGEQPDEITDGVFFIDNIKKILNTHFKKKEEAVFKMRFWIDMKCRSNIEIAKIYGFSKQRCSWMIQQMKQKMNRYKFLIFVDEDENRYWNQWKVGSTRINLWNGKLHG